MVKLNEIAELSSSHPVSCFSGRLVQGLLYVSNPPLPLQARWIQAPHLQAPPAHLLRLHHNPRPGPASMPLPHWNKTRLRPILPDLRLAPVWDQVLGKQSRRAPVPAAEKEWIELVRGRSQEVLQSSVLSNLGKQGGHIAQFPTDAPQVGAAVSKACVDVNCMTIPSVSIFLLSPLQLLPHLQVDHRAQKCSQSNVPSVVLLGPPALRVLIASPVSYLRVVA